MSLDHTALGPVELSAHLVLAGLESRPLLAYSVVQTLGGRAYVLSDALDVEVGQPLTLEADSHFTLAQLQAVQLLVGTEVVLVHHRGTFRVLVVAVPEEPTFTHADPAADDWHSGAIELILLEIIATP